MAVSTDPNTLLQESACLSCIPDGLQASVMIYLLQQIAGNTESPQQLIDAAAPYQQLRGMETEVVNYLLDQIAQAP